MQFQARSEDGTRFIHPLEKFSVMDFIDKTVSDLDPVKPPPVETTSFKLVQDVKDLKELAAKLHDADEFAIHRNFGFKLACICERFLKIRKERLCMEPIPILYGCNVTLVYMFAICFIDRPQRC